jgi:flagellar hook-basal body complex protein FliE
MKVNGIQTGFITPLETKRSNPSSSFSAVFNQYINDVNQTLMKAEQMSQGLATGNVKNLHDVTIANQKASIALQLTVQVRDKAIEAYQEMMRLQV